MPNPPVKFPKPNRSSGKPPVRKSDGNGPQPGPSNDQNWRGIIILFLTLLTFATLYYTVMNPGLVQKDISQTDLFNLIKAGQVDSIVNEPDPSTGLRMLTGKYEVPNSNGKPTILAFKVPVDLSLNPYLASEINQAGYKKIIETQANTNLFWPILLQF